jgi:uncharacterized protein (TIGR01777 family)
VVRLLRDNEVHRLVRPPAIAAAGDVPWQPGQSLDPAKLAAFDAIVHLAGRPIATLWTEKAKAEIRRSRVEGTVTIAQAVAESYRRSGMPHALISGSAIGYYGSRGDKELTEESHAGNGFLAEVCSQWEAATQPAVDAGLRVVKMRISVVLSPEGGALAKMLTPFRLGLGGRLGSGRQWMSWISLGDAARAFVFALENESLRGPVNLAAPAPVTNEEFTRALGHALHRPTLAAVPAFALRLAAGEMAEETLLSSQRVLPAMLLAAGFRFDDPELEPALRKMLA